MGARPRRIKGLELSREGKVPFTKIDVAVRQLETAIELWMADADPVSISTLSFSAHEIIYQINKAHPKRAKSLADADPSVLTEEGLRIWPTVFKLDYNFSKHGGGDPKEIHYYTVKNLPYVIFDSILMYNALEFGPRAVFRAFQMWMWFTVPEAFLKGFTDAGLNERDIREAVSLGKHKFFNHCVRLVSVSFAPRNSPVFHKGSN